MTTLVEARRDGRLDAEERASIERHLGGCAGCRALDEDLARLAALVHAPGAETTPLEHRRGRMRLLQVAAVMDAAPDERGSLSGLVASSPAHTRPGWRVPAVAALAAMLLAGAGASQTRVSAAPAQTPVASVASLASATSAAVAPGATLPEAVPSPTDAAPSVGEPAPKPAPRRDARPPSSAAPRAREAAAPRRAPAPETVDFASSVGSMERGDYGEAAERLEAFQKAHPHDARAEDAAFLRILAHERAGQHAAAARAARTYLASYPDGYKRAAAEAIAARGE
jgi:hypothetical protein